MNRYTLRIFFAVSLAAASISCSKYESVGPKRDAADGTTPGRGSSAPYSLAISAGQSADENAGTRATLDLGTYEYKWDVGDRVVMTVAPAGSISAVTGFDRFVMTGTNTVQTTHANFRADLSMAQYSALSAVTTFDYYSYFPVNINGLGNTNFPNSLSFTIPSTYTATPDAFVNAIYAPMVATVKNRAADIVRSTDLTEYADQVGGIHFDYNHVMSYAAIEMDVNLLPAGVTVKSITMTSNNNVMLWGTYTCTDMATGAGSYSGGSNVLTITIPGGLTVGSGQVIYLPMPVKDITGFTFAFDTGSATQGYESINTTANANFTTKGVDFQRGRIHKIRLAPSSRYTYGANMGGVNFQITQSGYYFIEAWGGNGGNKEVTGTIVATGGASNRIAGLYRFLDGEWITMYIGSAGINASVSATGTAAGGTNGSSYGNGGSGGTRGSSGGAGTNAGERGSGGGAATFVFRTIPSDPASTTYPGFTFPNDIVIVSGGGGGSGGAAQGSFGSNAASGGGAGASMDNIANNGGIGTNGSNGGTANMNGKGGGANGDAGVRGGPGNTGGYGSPGIAGSTTSGNGGGGGNAMNGLFSFPSVYSGGGGGGGGGGGWSCGGGGGGGGSIRGSLGTAPGAGGGGGGGQSYIGSTAPNPGYTFPVNTRVDPGNNLPINGYVFITFLRPL